MHINGLSVFFVDRVYVPLQPCTPYHHNIDIIWTIPNGSFPWSKLTVFRRLGPASQVWASQDGTQEHERG